MKISTWLKIFMVIFLALGSWEIFVLVSQKYNLEQIIKKTLLVNEIVKVVNQRENIVNDYINYKKNESITQWQMMYEITVRLLQSEKFNTAEEEAILEDMREENVEINKLFTALMMREVNKVHRTTSSALPLNTNEKIKSMLLDKGESIIDGAYRLNEIHQREIINIAAKTNIHTVGASLMITSLLFIILVMARKKVIMPLSRLHEGLQIIGTGNLNYKMTTHENNEIGEIIRAFNRMISQLKIRSLKQRLIQKKLKQSNREIRYIAEHDSVTDLANKALTKKTLASAILKAQQDHTIVAILYLDLDYFKRINDTIGHIKADQILQEVGRRLRSLSHKTDLVARFTGDEFCFIVQHISSKKDLGIIIKKIQDVISMPFVMDKKEFYITASIGVSLYPDDGQDCDFLIEQADLAMYQAKKLGRNEIQYASMKLRNIERRKGIIEAELRQAIKNNQLILHYQPIVDIKTNKIIGIEALVRWQDANGQLVFPDDFISIAEQSDLIILLGEWVLHEASKQFKAWQKYGLETMAVNISVHQLNDKLMEATKRALTQFGLGKGQLTFEITESTLMQESETMVRYNHTLEEMGIQISIDDFGIGYSSFNYLNKFKITYLKLDASFIKGIDKDNKKAAIVKAILQMAHTLNFKTISEGVETKEELEFLKQHHCDSYQGYYYSKPLPAEEFIKLLQHPKNPSHDSS